MKATIDNYPHAVPWRRWVFPGRHRQQRLAYFQEILQPNAGKGRQSAPATPAPTPQPSRQRQLRRTGVADVGHVCRQRCCLPPLTRNPLTPGHAKDNTPRPCCCTPPAPAPDMQSAGHSQQPRMNAPGLCHQPDHRHALVGAAHLLATAAGHGGRHQQETHLPFLLNKDG